MFGIGVTESLGYNLATIWHRFHDDRLCRVVTFHECDGRTDRSAMARLRLQSVTQQKCYNSPEFVQSIGLIGYHYILDLWYAIH